LTQESQMRRTKKHLDTTVRFPWGATLFLVTPRGSVRSRPRAAMCARCESRRRT